MLKCAGILDGTSGDPQLKAGQKVIVLVTDGADNIAPLGTNVAPSLKDGGFVLAAIGIGPAWSKRDLQGIASKSQLYKRFNTYDEFAVGMAAFAQSFCDIQGAVPPSPSPTSSTSPEPLGLPSITKPGDVPKFTRGKTDAYNLEALRAAFEYRISLKLGRRTRMRVSSCIESSAHPNFPWNLLGGDDRFYWPGQTPSPSPVIVSDRMLVSDENMPELSVRNLQKCPARSCAAYISIEAERGFEYDQVRSALTAIKEMAGFAHVFNANRNEVTRVVRTGPNSFAVFVMFQDRVTKSLLE